MGSRFTLAAVALVAIAGLASPAFAQDYTVTRVSGRWVTPPGSATALSLSSHSATNITLPFDFPYFGNTYTAARVGDEGWMQIGPSRQMNSTSERAFPNSTYDGLVCPAWMYHLHAGRPQIVTHTAGTAPNRVHYISWVRAGSYAIYAQVQLYETTGRIVFAYNGGTWTSRAHWEGMQAPGSSDRRYMLTDGVNSGKRRAPAGDFQFDPIATRFTGTLLMDRPTSDATGIGNSTTYGVPVGGATVQLINSASGGVVGFGVTNADGDFSVSGLALNSSGGGTLRVAAYGDAATVVDKSGGKPVTLALGKSVQFGQNSTVGTVLITDSTDAGGTVRSRLNILSAIQTVNDFAKARTSDAIPPITVYYDPASSATTSFTAAAGKTPAVLRVGSDQSGNPDQWDNGVIGRIYGVHVFDSIVEGAPSSYDLGWGGNTGPDNAIAVGFGYYLQAAASGSGLIVDATGASSATVRDLDVDAPLESRSQNVAGWVAMGFYDTLDGENEPHDVLDGTGDDPGRIFDAVDTLTAQIDCTPIFDAFVAQGGDGVGLARDFIYHNLIPDDASESNDSFDEAKYVGVAGVRVDDLVMTAYNEDWYRVAIPAATDAVFATVSFERASYDAAIDLEVFDASGNVLATGSTESSVSAFRATTATLPAGEVVVRVAHLGGPTVPNYTLQVFSRIEVSAAPIVEWTEDRPLTRAITVSGGIPPYRFQMQPPSVLPRGLVLDSAGARIVGTPTDPGEYTFSISTLDEGEPTNKSTLALTLDINGTLAFETPRFTGVAVGGATDLSLARVGGTDPVSIVDLDAQLPAGLTLDPDFHVRGSAASLGAGPLSFAAEDVAGADAAVDTTVVVCTPIDTPNAPLDLVAGAAAGGFYFDSLLGGSADLSVKTAKKRAKRTLVATIVGPDGREVIGAKSRARNGSIVVRNIPLLRTGRYFVILSGDEGDATQVLGTLKLGLPRRGVGEAPDLEFGEQVEIPFGAVPGTRFQLRARTTDGMDVRTLFLLDPDGQLVPFEKIEAKSKGPHFTMEVTTEKAGTYRLFLTPRPGPVGSLDYSFRLRHPRGAEFALTER